MGAPYEPRVQIGGQWYYPSPYSQEGLQQNLRNGLVALGLLAALSVGSTLVLIGFILNRFYSWRRHYRTFVGYNQYVVLVLNLLLADLSQGSSFLISWHWYRRDRIVSPNPACFAQGWLLHSGDIASGFFVLAIAVHTYYTAVYGRRVGYKTFAAIIISIWVLVYFLTVVGLGLHGKKYFTAAGAWCWVSPAYETDRLWCHYIWVFIVEFGTIAIYVLTFFSLRQKTRSLLVDGKIPPNSPSANTLKQVNRITMLMTLYPCVYVLLTLPLSAGRMWSMSHNAQATSDVFSVVAGCLLTSCGWVDSLLYTLTRKQLLQDTMPNSSSRRTDEWTKEGGITHTRTVTVEAGALVDFEMMNNPSDRRKRAHSQIISRPPSPTGSIDPILSGKGLHGMTTGQVKTEITVGHAEIDREDEHRHELNSSPVPRAYHRASDMRKYTDESDC
ncbi:integral membrane [Lecanosticta acicola]|uniref:Integral membrane n=1 Tax=Lecanosticta acicola TaxID=111012 RepID=A0AAI8YRE6_9PEZI|nr:integral membrane [Lecanosticta acicola]